VVWVLLTLNMTITSGCVFERITMATTMFALMLTISRLSPKTYHNGWSKSRPPSSSRTKFPPSTIGVMTTILAKMDFGKWDVVPMPGDAYVMSRNALAHYLSSGPRSPLIVTLNVMILISRCSLEWHNG
jgi:hypothetical protein